MATPYMHTLYSRTAKAARKYCTRENNSDLQKHRRVRETWKTVCFAHHYLRQCINPHELDNDIRIEREEKELSSYSQATATCNSYMVKYFT